MHRSTVLAFRTAVVLLAVLLAGCAETALLVDQTKRIAGSSDESAGGYKVGKPYRIDGVWYYPAADYAYSETGIASWYGSAFHGRKTANGEFFDMNALTAAHRTLPLPSLVRVTNLENGRALTLRVNDRGPFAHGRIIDVSRRAAQLLGFEQKGTAKVRVEILPEESRALAMQAGGGSNAPVLPGEPEPEAAPSVAIASEALPAPPGTDADSPAPGGKAQVEPGLAEPGMAEPGLAEPDIAVASTQMAAVTPPVPRGQVTIQPVHPTQLFIQAGAFVEYQNAYRLSALLSPLGPTTVTPAFVGGQQFFRVRLGPVGSVEDADSLLERVIDTGHTDARIIVE